MTLLVSAVNQTLPPTDELLQRSFDVTCRKLSFSATKHFCKPDQRPQMSLAEL
jgi:hypothetical protein